ncbi:hypothetical protein ACFW19_01005 [Streptomyces nigra]|uniref:hypothetical protein n=1 Tax=Streptomyces nigra TaxID=1827580 RepID=UPI0036B0E1A4
MRRGDWHDPDAGRVPFGSYAAAWIAERELTNTTRQLYGSLLRHHLEPTFGNVNVTDISPPFVRRWRADKLASETGPTTVAKAYALLRAILGTAVADQMIRRNPCTIQGASTVHTPERPTATVQEVYDLADAIQPRYRGARADGRVPRTALGRADRAPPPGHRPGGRRPAGPPSGHRAEQRRA